VSSARARALWFIFPAGPLDSRDVRALPLPEVYTFVANACLLVLELVAGRILAPRVGVSVYTWTAVIGVVLAGFSLGSWLGGEVADRRPTRSVLSLTFLLSAASSALVLALANTIDSVALPLSWAAILQVLWLTTVVFFLPSVLIGAVTPMIVKLSLTSLDETGSVVGRIRGAAELGGIVGVFLTGFVLLSAFGTRSIIACVAITLALLAIASNPIWSVVFGRTSLTAAPALADSSVQAPPQAAPQLPPEPIPDRPTRTGDAKKRSDSTSRAKQRRRRKR
jgi:MFS family permease